MENVSLYIRRANCDKQKHTQDPHSGHTSKAVIKLTFQNIKVLKTLVVATVGAF